MATITNRLEISDVDMRLARYNAVKVCTFGVAYVASKFSFSGGIFNSAAAFFSGSAVLVHLWAHLNAANVVHERAVAGRFGWGKRMVSWLTHPFKKIASQIPLLALTFLNMTGGNQLGDDSRVMQAAMAIALLPNITQLYEVGKGSLSGLKEVYYATAGATEKLRAACVHLGNLAMQLSETIAQIQWNSGSHTTQATTDINAMAEERRIGTPSEKLTGEGMTEEEWAKKLAESAQLLDEIVQLLLNRTTPNATPLKDALKDSAKLIASPPPVSSNLTLQAG